MRHVLRRAHDTIGSAIELACGSAALASHVIASATKQSIFLALSLVLAVFTACDSSSSSADPDPVAEVSSSSGDDGAISSSSVTDKGKSSGGSSKSSSSVKSGDDSQKSSSSSGYVLRDSLCSSDYEGWTQYIPQLQQEYICKNGHWVSMTSRTYKTCTSEKEGVEAYISQEESWCICTDGFWIPMSSSSVTPSSSSKYYDMSRLFENEYGYSYGEFEDPRDGLVYKTIRYEVGYYGLDSITVFAQNLNYGKMISGGTQMTDSTKFCYDDDLWYCENGFGGLYTWATVMNFPAACDTFAIGSVKCPEEYNLMSNPIPEFQGKLGLVFHQGICPEGWHVMNQEEWAIVSKGSVISEGGSYLGGILWGSNRRGFALLPAGVLQMGNSSGTFYYRHIEKYAYHWVLGEYKNDEDEGKWGLVAYVTRDQLNRRAGQEKVNGLSVRCTKDY